MRVDIARLGMYFLQILERSCQAGNHRRLPSLPNKSGVVLQHFREESFSAPLAHTRDQNWVLLHGMLVLLAYSHWSFLNLEGDRWLCFKQQSHPSPSWKHFEWKSKQWALGTTSYLCSVLTLLWSLALVACLVDFKIHFSCCLWVAWVWVRRFSGAMWPVNITTIKLTICIKWRDFGYCTIFL